MTQAVFFDVGNTLLYPYPSVAEVCREILLDAGHDRATDEIDAFMPLVDEYYEDRFREDDTFWTDEGETSQVWVGMYSLLCRELGLEENAEVLARRVYDEFGDPARWRVYPDVVPALGRLGREGLKLGVISNWDCRLEALLAGLDLAELFDAVISSACVGLHKPDPRIFEMACEMLDVAPGEAVHVGDHHYSDIVGASAVGMTAVLIDRHGGGQQGAITTLDDLETTLGWGE
jgi:putative hydrolase of the HAD superfamily